MASRANQRVLLRVALVCAAALLCLGGTAGQAVESQSVQPVVAAIFPVASDVRIAGDDKQTRFVLDLDRKIDVRAFTLADPYRVILDVPQVNFQLPAGVGQAGRGLIKAFRYGLVMPGGSRIVFDLTGPAKIEKAYVLDAANGQPSRLVVELATVDKATFKQAMVVQALVVDGKTQLRPSVDEQAKTTVVADAAGAPKGPGGPDLRPVIVIDPGHGGIDNGTVAASGEAEKTLVLDFAKALREHIEKGGKYRVVMTRSDDTFIPLGERVRIARNQKAALFVSIHADALPRGEGDAQGATVYTLSDKASDAEAERLAESENRADAIGGVNLTEEPTDVADILIDLAQRETRTFSNRFARLVVNELKNVARLHKHPLKSAGFKVLKAPDVPSVLVELGYVSNKDDLQQLVSENWRTRTVGSIGQAVEAFFGKRVVSAGSEH
ncbi:N-acetylmuramoyl-L-alanine amidase [Bradyrhizobium prioriisuperbiae]|uniref:N-acetylmuramoyl-L-alanine amidase n=1 Tax=Bradyrhizobium prioriisuperbiae TaxID=2854389 RepID=UPI0028EA7F8E|nr:N-acetylmuramoyl-L-alanine amidase [Bradyrhizobium prioritasuperba]